MKTKAIAWVLSCFEAMGATLEQLAHERQRLADDEHYLGDWCKTTGFKP